jgi:hypothetical protein
MNKQDGLVCSVLLLLVLLLSGFPFLREGLMAALARYPHGGAFVKFSLLATFGEALGARLRCGSYVPQGFGLLPKAVVWGVLGVVIHMAFVWFAQGVTAYLAGLGFWPEGEMPLRASRLTGDRLLCAFSVSVAMNGIFAPVMMTVHAITDRHIAAHGGALSALWQPVDVAGILGALDWRVQVHFVFFQTIVFFWIPAHTLTFLLPSQWRVLFAAFLGVLLGVFLALAARQKAVSAESQK